VRAGEEVREEDALRGEKKTREGGRGMRRRGPRVGGTRSARKGTRKVKEEEGTHERPHVGLLAIVACGRECISLRGEKARAREREKG